MEVELPKCTVFDKIAPRIINRQITDKLIDLAQHYPIVTVIGPRQAGKTTLVKEVFRDKPYLNLEAPDMRKAAIVDPRGLLNKYPEGAILDEVPRVPQLLSYL